MAASNAGIQAVASSKRTESAASRVRVSRMKVDSSSGYSGGSSRVLGAPANECTTGRIVPTKRQLRSISCSGTRVSPRSPTSARHANRVPFGWTTAQYSHQRTSRRCESRARGWQSAHRASGAGSRRLSLGSQARRPDDEAASVSRLQWS